MNLVEILSSENKEEIQKGLEQLAESSQYLFLPRTVRLMSHPDRGVSSLAQKISIQLSEHCVKERKKIVSKDLIALSVQIVKKFRPQFVDILQRQIAVQDTDVVIDGLIALKYFLRPDRAKIMLDSFSRNPDPKARATAILHLGRTVGSIGIGVLTQYVEDKDSRVRANAIEVLEMLHNKKLVSIIGRFRNDNNNRVRANVLKALFTLGEREGIAEDLKAMLTHPEPLMRTSAVWVIGEIGTTDKGYLPLLKLVTQDEDRLLKNNLLIVLKKVGDLPELDFLKERMQNEIVLAKMIQHADIQLEQTRKKNYLLLKISGQFTMDKILSLKLRMDQVSLASVKHLVFDFTGIEFINNNAVAFLTNLTQRLDEKRITVYFFGCNFNIVKLFQLSGLDQKVNLFETEEEVSEFIDVVQ